MLFRSDILVTDWLLDDGLDGLDIDEALKIVNIRLQTVLITAFLSKDLKASAEQNSIAILLEKPFTLDRLVSEINQVRLNKTECVPSAEIGIFKIDFEGDIVFSNHIFSKLSFQAGFNEIPNTIRKFCKTEQFECLFTKGNYWRELFLASPHPIKWIVHPIETKDPNYTSFVVLAEETASYLKNSPLVCNLLGIPDPAPLCFDFSGHFLVVDNVDSVRRVIGESIRLAGGKVHTAATQDEAIRIFAHDGKIKTVILDYGMPDSVLKKTIQLMHEIRLGVKFLGTSGEVGAHEFAELGICDFLPKPWQIHDLIKFLSTNIAHR